MRFDPVIYPKQSLLIVDLTGSHSRYDALYGGYFRVAGKWTAIR
jgi:hypothetical protein